MKNIAGYGNGKKDDENMAKINDEKFISPIRLIGITVSSIKEEKIEQLKLF